jgi:hypothetical protein
MKINSPSFAIRVMTPNDISIDDQLENKLCAACHTFLDEETPSTLLDCVEELAVAQRIAISQYLTGLKIQKFANKIAEEDNIKLTIEINEFLKTYNKATN